MVDGRLFAFKNMQEVTSRYCLDKFDSLLCFTLEFSGTLTHLLDKRIFVDLKVAGEREALE